MPLISQEANGDWSIFRRGGSSRAPQPTRGMRKGVPGSSAKISLTLLPSPSPPCFRMPGLPAVFCLQLPFFPPCWLFSCFFVVPTFFCGDQIFSQGPYQFCSLCENCNIVISLGIYQYCYILSYSPTAASVLGSQHTSPVPFLSAATGLAICQQTFVLVKPAY